MNKEQQKWWSLIGIGLSALIIAIDFTIVNTVLANIQNDFHATIGQLQWVMAGFGLLFCTLLAVVGPLGDIFGHRLMIYIGITGFAIASLGAGLSQTPGQLILFRIIQGAFGSIIFPNGVAIVANVFPKEEQGKGLGIYGSILGTGLAIGPVLGGFIVSVASWRWIFFINIPIMLISLLICFAVLKESKLKENVSIDWWGLTFITLFVASLVYAIAQSPDLGWNSPIIISLLLFALVCLVVSYFIEIHAKHPIIPPHLFTNSRFLLGCIIAIATISFAWSIIFITPLYLHNVLNKAPYMVGLLLLPMTMMTAITPIMAGSIYDRKGSLFITLLTFIALIVGLGLQLFFGTQESLILILLAFIAYGFAWGAGNGIAVPIALSGFKVGQDAGTISGVLITMLNIVGVLCLSVGTTVFRYMERSHLYTNLTKAKISFTESQGQSISALLSDPDSAMSYINTLGAEGQKILQLFKESFVFGYHGVVLIFFILSIVGMILSIALYRSTSKGISS